MLNALVARLLGAFVLILSCALPVQAAQPPLQVVSSFSILGDLVKQVGGDAVVVSTLVGPDGDAHVFEPRPVDARRVAQADLVFVNGLNFEGWMARLVTSSGYRGKLITASQGVKPRQMKDEHEHEHGHDHDHDHGNLDPHAWQDLANGIIYVENIRAALVAARPEQAEAINARAARYTAQLREMDAFVRNTLARVPAEKRRIITSHDAFGYFGAAYGVELLSPQGRSTESEASASDVAALIRQMKAKQVRAVFVENVSNPRMIERIAREGGGVVGGRLYSDALSSSNEANTYLKMFQHNASTLASAMLKQ
jgi:zinc/manganese transport system substrate-binding protein